MFDLYTNVMTEAEKMEAFNAEWDAKIEAAAVAGDEDLVEELMIQFGNEFAERFPS